MLATDLGDVRLSARNQLTGTITAVTPGAVNTEVVLDIGGGASVAAGDADERAGTRVEGGRFRPRRCSRPPA